MASARRGAAQTIAGAQTKPIPDVGSGSPFDPLHLDRKQVSIVDLATGLKDEETERDVYRPIPSADEAEGSTVDYGGR